MNGQSEAVIWKIPVLGNCDDDGDTHSLAKIQNIYCTFLRDWPSLSDSANMLSAFHFHICLAFRSLSAYHTFNSFLPHS